ncbi:MAG: DUF5605 domain-containing protein [Lachnospirales bacterium]
MAIEYNKKVEKWDVFEVVINGPSENNPFIDQWVKGTFIHKKHTVEVDGFYDDKGIYKIRFMPSFVGDYMFNVESSFGMNEEGCFESINPTAGNKGPVRVANTFHFAYEDGTPYYSIGTTCYVWNLQSDELIKETLNTLRDSAFNKIRFCIFPKHYNYNFKEPRSYPYEGTPMDSRVLTKENFKDYTPLSKGNDWNFNRFNTEHFAHIENCILELQKIGIEADIIVMHPYDRWGFSNMSSENDVIYWKYVMARLSAFRNVWWSLANEYDLLEYKSHEDWESYARIISEKDPYNHLTSIHNCRPFYDYKLPWITHCSIQRQELYRTAELTDKWRLEYRKPIVLDEICYEGNIEHGWGNISGEEMLRRFWEAACRGGYPGHGETYLNDEDILWWSHGGKLHGESHKRFKLLLEVYNETPGLGLAPYDLGWDGICAVPEMTVSQHKKVKDYYLIYYSFMQPLFKEYYFDDETSYSVQVIDTWNMTREDKGVFKGKFKVELLGKPYIAVQIKKVCQE